MFCLIWGLGLKVSQLRWAPESCGEWISDPIPSCITETLSKQSEQLPWHVTQHHEPCWLVKMLRALSLPFCQQRLCHCPCQTLGEQRRDTTVFQRPPRHAHWHRRFHFSVLSPLEPLKMWPSISQTIVSRCFSQTRAYMMTL